MGELDFLKRSMGGLPDLIDCVVPLELYVMLMNIMTGERTRLRCWIFMSWCVIFNFTEAVHVHNTVKTILNSKNELENYLLMLINSDNPRLDLDLSGEKRLSSYAVCRKRW